jgi:hypothetical protein
MLIRVVKTEIPVAIGKVKTLKLLLRIVGAIVICFIVLLAAARTFGFEPRDCSPYDRSLSCKVPGLWLRGEPVTTPVTDWSFTDQVQQIKIQTRTPFLLPHSVTIWCAVYNGNLYVTSNPSRSWVQDVFRDPHVRVKIGGRLFDTTFKMINDPAEKTAVLQAKGKKYTGWKVSPVAASTVFQVVPD